MQIDFSGTLSESDLRTGITRQMYPAFICGFMMFALGLLALLLSLISSKSNTSSLISTLFPIAMGLVLISLPRFTARRQFKSNKLLAMPVSGSVSLDGVILFSEIGSANIKWEHFHKCIISPNAVLLFQSSAVFHIFPSSFFKTGEDWLTFKSQVKSKVKHKRNIILMSIMIWLAIIAIVMVVLKFWLRA